MNLTYEFDLLHRQVADAQAEITRLKAEAEEREELLLKALAPVDVPAEITRLEQENARLRGLLRGMVDAALMIDWVTAEDFMMLLDSARKEVER